MRGGYRPGAGGQTKAKGTAPAKAELETPLDYMLRVMRDPKVDVTRRDRMAIAAAPFVHGRAMDMGNTKKSQRATAATQAAEKFAIPSPPPRVVQ